jgi:hypothetical protein
MGKSPSNAPLSDRGYYQTLTRQMEKIKKDQARWKKPIMDTRQEMDLYKYEDSPGTGQKQIEDELHCDGTEIPDFPADFQDIIDGVAGDKRLPGEVRDELLEVFATRSNDCMADEGEDADEELFASLTSDKNIERLAKLSETSLKKELDGLSERLDKEIIDDLRIRVQDEQAAIRSKGIGNPGRSK